MSSHKWQSLGFGLEWLLKTFVTAKISKSSHSHSVNSNLFWWILKLILGVLEWLNIQPKYVQNSPALNLLQFKWTLPNGYKKWGIVSSGKKL